MLTFMHKALSDGNRLRAILARHDCVIRHETDCFSCFLSSTCRRYALFLRTAATVNVRSLYVACFLMQIAVSEGPVVARTVEPQGTLAMTCVLLLGGWYYGL